MADFVVKKNNAKDKSRSMLVILSLLLVVTALSGTLLARYIADNRYRAEMLSSDFHISSNYLEEGAATYKVTDGKNAIVIELYNYEKENVAQIAGEDIAYEIQVPTGWDVNVKDESGDVAATNGVYTISGDGNNKVTQILTITPVQGAKKGEVKVVTKTPFKKELKAEFNLSGTAMPDYSIADKGNYVVVTVHTNGYTGDLQVEWTAEFSPDHSNESPNMSGWLDSVGKYSFAADEYTTYEMIFFKNTDDDYSKALTESTTIAIGGE